MKSVFGFFNRIEQSHAFCMAVFLISPAFWFYPAVVWFSAWLVRAPGWAVTLLTGLTAWESFRSVQAGFSNGRLRRLKMVTYTVLMISGLWWLLFK